TIDGVCHLVWRVMVEADGATRPVLVRAGERRVIELADRRAVCRLDIDEQGQMGLDAWWGNEHVRPRADIAPGHHVQVGQVSLRLDAPPVIVGDLRRLARSAPSRGSPTFGRAKLTFENLHPDVVRIVGVRDDHTFELDPERTVTLGITREADIQVTGLSI